MARLTSLSVKFVLKSSTRLFDGFTFPALASLDIEAEEGFCWIHPEHFYDQLKSLRTFTFRGRSGDLLELLRHTPSLVTLQAITYIDLNPLLFELTATPESNPVVPKLKHLTIRPDEWIVDESPSVGLLATMVTSRIKYRHAATCPLESLTIFIWAVLPHGNDRLNLERQLYALPMSKVEWEIGNTMGS